MDCITCNLEINNENYIICSCGNTYLFYSTLLILM